MSAISLYAKPSCTFAQKLQASRALLIASAARHTPITQASSLGAEDMVLTHLIAATQIDCSVFVLDTGMLHPQTLALIEQIQTRYDRRVDLYRPEPTVAAQFIANHGQSAMYKSLALRKACCDFRKMVPLARALEGKKAWITGLRREQSNARAEVPDVEQQHLVVNGEATSRAKINPLADWTWGDVWHFISEENIPYNPLHDAFFPSIGCAPCTRAVTLGEDSRSGRWWWEHESAKECGLHVDDGHTTTAGAAQELPAFESLSATLSLLPSSVSKIAVKEIPV